METPKSGIYRRFFKRPMDFFLSLTALIILSPVLVIIGLLVRIKLGSPVIFKQERPGLNEKIFTMYKFRTMTDEKDENGKLLPDSTRLTTFGRILRSTSLDELPELFNVLKGDMSLVGPRPLLPEYVPLYNKQQRKRLSVLPGITGWAQVNGRNALTWEEKFKLDTWYVENWNLILDLKIIAKTIQAIIKREGISAQGEATMPRFTGSVLTEISKQGKDYYE
ncbi:Undecaprenyl-phosphate galactose phosphotransferase [Aminobacterium colombiense DSM 12261]|uniref:Undecaprenyl-phosphate galactose phosphotransferase n=2 Tax=Aminobacterium TaxID=81466 RepID=D5EH00_AMICL|nr:Undecaprenyl-phosphate galactose phosphotransferase [Aminobacterium colombiense DSM 12261]